MIPAPLRLLLLQAQPAAAPEAFTYWALKTGEWITIAAILVGPIAAVLAQLWIQARRQKRDQKMWVYGTLMSFRATWVAPDFVRAMNFVDVVFHKNADVRAKRKEWLASIRNRNLDGSPIQVDWNKAEDLFAELLDLMGKELGYDFAHTEIKDTAYYPEGHEKMDRAAIELREKGLAVLEGKANIGVVVHAPTAAPAPQSTAPAVHAPRPPR